MGDKDREATADAAEPGEAGKASGSAATTASHRPERTGLFIAGAVLAACAGLVLYGVLDTGEGEGKPKHRTPTASVTYEVTGEGTADLTYQARDTSGKATVVHNARLPWRKTVDVPLGHDPLVSIVLDEHGGTARCTLAIRGHHVQSATATGTFGRTTCSGPLPTPQANQN